MRLPRECYQMQQVIETHLPHLSRPQLTGLVLWVCGAVLAGSACQNAVASALSPWGRWNNLRQYLGTTRRRIGVRRCGSTCGRRVWSCDW